MNTEVTNAVKATNKDAQYDTSAKRLLANKNILAHILIKTVADFKGMKPSEVIPYIVGNPYISVTVQSQSRKNFVFPCDTVKFSFYIRSSAKFLWNFGQ